MLSPYPQIGRNLYFDAETNFPFEHDSEHLYSDFQSFHLPMARLQRAHSMDWGVLRGLTVSGTIGANELKIEAGLATDQHGRLIVLSSEDEGKGDIRRARDDEPKEVGVPIDLSTESFAAGLYYVTIQYTESLRDHKGAGGWLDVVPWIRLSQPDDYALSGAEVVLATVRIGESGELLEIAAAHPDLPERRRLAGTNTGHVVIRRSLQVVAENEEESRLVLRESAPAGTIRPLSDGGIQITVPNATDDIELAPSGPGNFSQFTLRANSFTASGDLRISGNAMVNGALTANVLSTQSLVVADKGPTSDVRRGGTIHVSTPNPWSIPQLRVTQENSKDYARVVLESGEAEFHLAVGGHQSGTPDVLHVWSNSSKRNLLTVTANGRIGIGVENPAETLHINGSIRGNQGGSVRFQTDHGWLDIGVKNEGWAHFYTDRPLYYFNRGIRVDSGIIGSYNEDLQLQVAGSTRVTARTDGKVGIGLTNPATNLHVRARIATGVNTQIGGAITFFPPDGAAWFHIDNGPTRRSTGRLRISHGGKPGDREIMSIVQNGNVGIGTTTPRVRLHVTGNRIRLTNGSNSNQYLDLRADGSALDLESRGGDLYINNHGLHKTRIKNFVNISSRDYKEDITDLSFAEALYLLGGLCPVKYHHIGDNSREDQIGFVAEDVPTLFSTSDRKAYKPTDVIAVLTRVIQEQQLAIERLAMRLNALAAS